jgi:hypothetical protein
MIKILPIDETFGNIYSSGGATTGQLTSVAQTLGPIYVNQSQAHFNEGGFETKYKSFADYFSDKEKFLEIFDRKNLKAKLKALINVKHQAGEWIGTKSQMEYLAGLERDYRTRMRTRIDYARSGALGSNFIKMSMTKCGSKIDAILSQ